MTAYYEAKPGHPFDPQAVFTSCVESGAQALLLDQAALPAEFSDLSTGIAGELLHKLSTYRIRLAAVLPDPTLHSPRFQDFVRESNKGNQFRFFATRRDAVEWLESETVSS